jgi:hypothetical protein
MAIKGHSGRWGSWHIGEDMNIPAGRVITFQVDGDELEWLIQAIKERFAQEFPWGKVNFPATHLTPVL